ncbi:N-formylglutamate amidohydrolase [Bradyrhizobium sp. BR 1432]|uniref:N-formylglutamate amidohydrolase n=1 Tax=Bradyrhizobium sp. BR 1432 TaxID=3447966 RepID=UPI003EE80D89
MTIRQSTEIRNGMDARKIAVLHIPHSSRLIPADERARLSLGESELETELLRMTDAFTDELFPPTLHEAERVVFPVSRLVCDVERFSDDADEPMAGRGMGAIYTATSTGRRLRATASAPEHERIMTRWYRPHHELLTSAVDKVLRREDRCLIIDCHSFADRPLPHEPDQDPRRPEICIGTDPLHTAHGLSGAIADAARKLGFTVAADRPFSGALVPAKHYRADMRVQSLMIEVNRRVYMNELTGDRLVSFEKCREAVGSLVSTAATFLLSA